MVSLVEKNTHTLTDWRIDDSLESVQLNGREDRDVVGVMIENGKQQQQKTAQENDRITSERR